MTPATARTAALHRDGPMRLESTRTIVPLTSAPVHRADRKRLLASLATELDALAQDLTAGGMPEALAEKLVTDYLRYTAWAPSYTATHIQTDDLRADFQQWVREQA